MNFQTDLKQENQKTTINISTTIPFPTHVYKASFRKEGGGINRPFAFWGRILVPAAVFFGFLGRFLHVFFMH